MSDNPEDEVLDPRIQIELEQLNTCTDEINRLETQLDEANALYQFKMAEFIQKQNQMIRKLGKCIEKARPYYAAREVARQAQLETQKAAVQYQRAVATHLAAKETITLAEQRFLSKQEEWEFDAAWQEMLNHATMKVVEAENNRAKSEHEHQKKAKRFTLAEKRVQLLYKQLKSDANKARPYFDLKDQYQKEFEELKELVQNLQKAILNSKTQYSESLHNLEIISEQIHARRKLMQPREPGVGAEKEIELPDVSLDKIMDGMVKELLQKDSEDNDDANMSQDGSCCSSEQGDSSQACSRTETPCSFVQEEIPEEPLEENQSSQKDIGSNNREET